MAASNETSVEITRQELRDFQILGFSSITNVNERSSYSWVEAPTPTIAVPGKPPRWSPPSNPPQLKKDSGFTFIAQNAARHPDSPLEPLFRALYQSDPAFDIRSIDIVTDRNNLRKLLSFAFGGSAPRNGPDSFVIHVEVTKNTAIFCHGDTATYEIIGPDEFRGYNREFEKAYTTRAISGSTGHYRILTYRLGGLNFLVRHETDGYVDAEPASSSIETRDRQRHKIPGSSGSSSLATASCHLQLTPPGSKLTIKQDGEATPLKSILAIKTRVFHKSINFQEIAPQLWISQTSKLVRAYHRHGIFQNPKVEDVTADMKTWQQSHQQELKDFAALICRIAYEARVSGGKAIVKYDKATDKLTVTKSNRQHMLPQDLYCKWYAGRHNASEIISGRCTAPQLVINASRRVEGGEKGKSVLGPSEDVQSCMLGSVVKGPERPQNAGISADPRLKENTRLSSETGGESRFAADLRGALLDLTE